MNNYISEFVLVCTSIVLIIFVTPMSATAAFILLFLLYFKSSVFMALISILAYLCGIAICEIIDAYGE